MKVRELFYLISAILLIGIALIYFVWWPPVLWFLILIGPLILLGIYDTLQTKHTIRRNFPLIGNFRYMLERVRPEIQQYFVETDTEGRPINRLFRSIAYQRAKKAIDTTPFGTQMELYKSGYEWMSYSIYASGLDSRKEQGRVTVGGEDCKHPYSSSILNISAMSFGALSDKAVLAFNKGAKRGNFAQNTGEGSISPYHLKYGGDLIWQIGTGYFGCRDEEGNFHEGLFAEKAQWDSVKMIELKISQGAKPGHGGILPASKNSKEIAAIRHVEPHTTISSPPSHTAFSGPEGLMHFIKKLRDLSGGKPVGFKLVIGLKSEFIDICRAMIKTGIKPDFITIDGGEGGTGAAPIEFSNRLGAPIREGLAFAINTLRGYDLKKDIKVVASGKVITGFHIARLLALGADMVNSARAMMLAIGCIQALQCNLNTCPTGITTQNKSLTRGLVVDDKAIRVANYHEETLRSLIELVAATGVKNLSDLNRGHIERRVSMSKVLNYRELYPEVEEGAYLVNDVDAETVKVT